MGATRGKGIHTLDDARWTPVYQHRQSRYVEGLCERCGGPIAPNEVHETRGWRHGPAEACQHIECPVEPWVERIVREVAEGLPNTPAWMPVIERIAERRVRHEMDA